LIEYLQFLCTSVGTQSMTNIIIPSYPSHIHQFSPSNSYGSTAPLGPWPLIFSFMIILQTAGLLGRVISSSQGLYLNTGQHEHTISTYTYQISMLCVALEPTISASERAKTVHALDRSATVTGRTHIMPVVDFCFILRGSYCDVVSQNI
jgi:hypothetical protein